MIVSACLEGTTACLKHDKPGEKKRCTQHHLPARSPLKFVVTALLEQLSNISNGNQLVTVMTDHYMNQGMLYLGVTGPCLKLRHCQ